MHNVYNLDFALDNLQGLWSYKTQSTNQTRQRESGKKKIVVLAKNTENSHPNKLSTSK